MKKILKKLLMTLCALAICIGFVGGPSNSVTADAATTKTKRVVINSPNVLGTYDAYIVVNGKSTKIGTSKMSIGKITLDQKVSMTINKKGSFYIMIQYKGPGGGRIASNIINIISEQQLKTGFYSIRVDVPSPAQQMPKSAKAVLSVLP